MLRSASGGGPSELERGVHETLDAGKRLQHAGEVRHSLADFGEVFVELLGHRAQARHRVPHLVREARHHGAHGGEPLDASQLVLLQRQAANALLREPLLLVQRVDLLRDVVLDAAVEVGRDALQRDGEDRKIVPEVPPVAAGVAEDDPRRGSRGHGFPDTSALRVP